MILYIVRHAWAGQHGDPAYPDDRLRPLTKEGKKRFAKVVKKLADRGFEPTAIVTSPLVRCRQTADLVAERLSGDSEVIERPELEPDSNLAGLLEWTNRELGKHQEVAWVGHAPDVGRMTAALLGAEAESIDFAKGAVAAIQFDDRPKAGQGVLSWLATPKILGC